MVKSDPQEGRYRVLLMGVGNNSEEERDSFCHNLSKSYPVPPHQLKKIVDRCPVILKKNLSLRKAELLAKTFRSFGASVSVEERIQHLPISLEFQELAPHRLALESSSLRKSPGATWSVTGRAKNISDEALADTWVLIQLFEEFEEFIAFEETPLPINPLPSGQSSPFKVIFEGGLSIKKISIGFKNASGQPIPAVDRRKKREWVKMDSEDEGFFPPPPMPAAPEEKSQVVDDAGPPGNMAVGEEKAVSEAISFPLEQEVLSPGGGEIREDRDDAEKSSEESLLLSLEPLEKTLGSSSALPKEDSDSLASPTVSKELGEEIEAALDELAFGSDGAETAEESRPETPGSQESAPWQDISETPDEAKVEVEEKALPYFSWIEDFRKSVETFYQTSRDRFSIWFEECRKKGELKDSLHGLLTLLAHSRFDQGNQSNKALENTQKVFQLILQPNLLLEQIPPLEGTPFVSGEVWGDLFHRALSKVHQIGNAVVENKKWKALDLEQLIQVIPHMGRRNSRMAVRWINELIPDVVEVDFSDTPVMIEERLYRVAARLGIVEPHLDPYQGKDSIGDAKIQSFAVTAFPHDPVKVEKPMVWIGGGEEQGGHCFTVQPWCEGCLFKTFCPRLCLDFDPSAKGMLAEG